MICRAQLVQLSDELTEIPILNYYSENVAVQSGSWIWAAEIVFGLAADLAVDLEKRSVAGEGSTSRLDTYSIRW